MLLKDKQIFIVEDNPPNRVVFQMALVRHGATVEFERSGYHTIYHLKQLPRIDLIILDLMLADSISGFEVFAEIRALPAHRKTPILAVSAMDAATAIPRAKLMGFSGFIPKPINMNTFAQQLVRVMDGGTIWDVGQQVNSY
ncbi:MAG: response regulator [Anaerolineae bacterium]|nr:response regulator [Anaerolineae bacterium]